MATRIEKTDLARDALYYKVNTMIDEVNTKIDNKDSLPSQTGKAGKFLTTDGTNASWGEVKQIKIKQDLTNPSADTVPSTKAVKDESSRITTLMNTKVSNCITYIPQDIKLELNNGTLTLKAGSKVYVPNGKNADGSNKFDVVVIESDISLTQGWGSSQTFLLFYDINGSRLRIYDTGRCYSGTTSVSDGAYYNTNDNKLYVYDGGSLNFTASLPIAIITGQSPTITSIDQVFNGFGYIGSTVFALPGVKGRIPNGRNADGSLKSIVISNDSVKTSTFPVVSTHTSINIGLTTDAVIDLNFFTYYEKENIMKNLQQSLVQEVNCATLDVNNGIITSFNPKTVFHALDYNDKSTISGWSMPSSEYIDLTLGSSGTFYIAPTNGYFYFRGAATAANQYIDMENQTSKYRLQTNAPGGRIFCTQIISARNGDMVRISYTLRGQIDGFRFIYAEGENS